MLKNKAFAVSGNANLSGGYPISYTAFYDSNRTEHRVYGADTNFSALTYFGASNLTAILNLNDTSGGIPKYEFGLSSIDLQGNINWSVALRSILGLLTTDSVKHTITAIDVYNDTLYALLTSSTFINLLARLDQNGNLLDKDTIKDVDCSPFQIKVGTSGVIFIYSIGTFPNYTVTLKHRNWNNEVTWIYKGKDSTEYRSDFMDGIIEGNLFSFISRMVHLNSTSTISSHSTLCQISTLKGEVVFTKEYIDTVKSFSLMNLVRAEDGGFLMTGAIEENAPWISYLFKTDPSGNIYESDIGTIFPSSNSIFENPIESGILIYPNPTDGLLHIEALSNSIANISIYDSFGRIIKERTVKDSNTNHDLTELSPGVYFIRVEDENKSVSNFKIIKL
jgi:hypothetical protein